MPESHTPDAPATGSLIFLSYSRRDRELALAIGKTIKATGAQPWRDEDSISPGADWQLTITENIDRCERMFVLWCRHSGKSPHVEKEYLYAIDRQKTIVPVPLDRTSVPSKLRTYQTLDDPLFRTSHQSRSSEALAVLERFMWSVGIVLFMVWSIYAAVR